MKVIIISGVPGTGKTKIAKAISKINKADYINIGSFSKKIFKGYNKRLKTRLVDKNKFVNEAIRIIKKYKKLNKNLVIDSHLSHYIPHKYVDLCIITKCDLRKLGDRLKKRKYPFKKIRENLDAEIMDVCLLEAALNKHKIEIIDTTKGFKLNNLKKII